MPMLPVRATPADTLIVLVATALAGLVLPDFDLALLGVHRLGWSHSVLPVLLAAALTRSPAATAGLALGIAAHLAADLFPEAMRGYALIKLWPVLTLGPLGSYLWLAANLAACAWAADRALALVVEPHIARWLFAAALGLAAFYVVSNGESVLTLGAMGAAFGAKRGLALLRR